MRAQAEQTGAVPQPIRRADGPKPGLPARASQGSLRGGAGGGGRGSRVRSRRDYGAIKNLHTRNKPGLSTVETESQAPWSTPRWCKLELTVLLHSPLVEKEALREGAPRRRPHHQGRSGGANVNAHLVCPGFRLGAQLQLESIIMAREFSIVSCLLPSSLFPVACSFTLSHTEEGARRDSSPEGRETGLSVEVYTHRLGRAWSLLHPTVFPSGLSDFLIVALASDPVGNASATHARSF